jgi:hypothetical protein
MSLIGRYSAGSKNGKRQGAARMRAHAKSDISRGKRKWRGMANVLLKGSDAGLQGCRQWHCGVKKQIPG